MIDACMIAPKYFGCLKELSQCRNLLRKAWVHLQLPPQGQSVRKKKIRDIWQKQILVSCNIYGWKRFIYPNIGEWAGARENPSPAIEGVPFRFKWGRQRVGNIVFCHIVGQPVTRNPEECNSLIVAKRFRNVGEQPWVPISPSCTVGGVFREITSWVDIRGAGVSIAKTQKIEPVRDQIVFADGVRVDSQHFG